MKKLLLVLPILILTFIVTSPKVLAQGGGMMGNGMMGGGNTIVSDSDGHTAREEAEGKVVWEKLQAKELDCKDLSDEDFGALGEYFMGQMTGDSHEAMNEMMIRMMGEEGEEAMHVVMGKRMSGCESDAPFPAQGMMSMTQMMGGGMMGTGLQSNWGMMNGSGMMSGWGFWTWIGGLSLIIWLVVGIVAVIWLIKQLGNRK